MADTIVCVDYLNAKAQLRLVNLRCQVAKGKSMSPKEAVQWYKELAKQYNAYAEFELGKCYETGYGIRKNYKTAAGCYQRASTMAIQDRADNPDTIYSKSEKCLKEAFDMMDNNPDFFEQDEKEKFKLCQGLAESGNAAAQNELGYYYLIGMGVAKDYDEAFYWSKKSAEQGNAKGQNRVAFCYQYGQGVEKDLQKALYWYYKSAKQGYESAMVRLGEIYYDGDGVAKSYAEAAKWFRRSTERTFNWVEMMEI